MDIIGAERNKDSQNEGELGKAVSQNAQLTPFTHDCLSQNSTLDTFDVYGMFFFAIARIRVANTIED